MNKKKFKELAAKLPKTDAELQALLSDLVKAQTRRERAVAERDGKFAEECANLEKMYGWGSTIAAADETIKQKMELLEVWAEMNRPRMGDAKSLAMNGHRFGWRLGAWSTVAKKWADVVDYLQRLVEKGKGEDASAKQKKRAAIAQAFVAVVVKPNKEAMIRDRDSRPARAILKAAGVDFAQEESFFFDPSREGQAPARIEGA